MRDRFLDYHQTLELRLLGMTLCIGLFALGCVMAYGLRTVCHYLVTHTPRGIPIWQRHTQ